MSWISAETVPLDIDLQPVIAHLKRLNVPCWVSEEGGAQIIWLQSLHHKQHLDQALLCLKKGELVDFQSPGSSKKLSLDIRYVKRVPVTLTLLVLSMVGALLIFLDSDYEIVRWLTFTQITRHGNSIYLSDMSSVLMQGEVWRLVTPMFLHFGMFHILFNGLWIWEMGRRIELQRSGLILVVLTLTVSIASNVMQYGLSGPSLFGGMSGVLYGYLGYIWMWQRISPQHGFGLPSGVIGFMLVWLVLCFTGVVDYFMDGNVANGAHLGGLLGGIIFGLVSILWAKIAAYRAMS